MGNTCLEPFLNSMNVKKFEAALMVLIGMMLYRGPYEKKMKVNGHDVYKLLQECEKHIERVTTFKMHITVKEMDEGINLTEEDLNTVDVLPYYRLVKEKFEQTNFKCNNIYFQFDNQKGWMTY